MSKIYTKAKKILVGVWTGDDYDTAPSKVSELNAVIADSLSVTQDDPDTTDIDCETSDDPIFTVATAGQYQVELNNANIDESFLTEIMGFKKDGTFVSAPATYESRYIALQVEFESNKFLIVPKILVAPKLVFESLSTNIAYGTLSGTATSAKIGTMTEATPLALSSAAVLTLEEGTSSDAQGS
jgi:hypothetical protein